MKKNVFLIIFALFFVYSKTKAQNCTGISNNINIPNKCFEIESILVDACDGINEAQNEMVRLRIGPNPIVICSLKVAPYAVSPNPTVLWGSGSPNPFRGFSNITTEPATLAKITTINASILAAGNCGRLIPLDSTSSAPAGCKLLIITSTAFNPNAQDFSGLTDTLFVIIQNPGNVSSGHFANQPSSGTRKLILYVGTCSDTVTYVPGSLIKQDQTVGPEDGGTVNFTYSGAPTYVNYGCTVPMTPLTCDAGTTNSNYCNGVSVNLTGTVTGSNCYVWRASNTLTGTFSDTTNLVTTFSISNGYVGAIKLYLFAKSNCSKKLDSVIFNAASSSSVLNAGSDTVLCNLLAFQINATSNSIGDYTWTKTGAGNFNQTNILNPIYNPSILDTGIINLIVNQNTLCGILKDTIKLNYSAKPKVGFTTNNSIQCVNGNNFLFNDTSTISSGTYTRQWNLGININDTSSLSNPNKVYLTANTFSIKLIATSNNGCKDSIIKTVTLNPKPSVGFITNNLNQCLINNNYLFTDTSNISGGVISKRLWQISNNDTSSNLSFNKKFIGAGVYLVKLIEESNYGCKDSTNKIITIFTQPKAGFTINKDSQCLKNNSFFFTDTTANNTCIWNTGIGNNQTTKIANQTYTNSGNYSIKLVVVSANNCIDSITKTISLIPDPIVGPIVGQTTGLTSGSPYIYNITQQLNHTYNWTITNGIILSGQGTNSVIVQWVSAGIGKLKVEIKNTNDCNDTNSLNATINSVGINEVLTQFDFNIYPNPNNGNFTIQLKNTFEKSGTITIVDMLGRTVYEMLFKLNGNEDTISISQLPLKAGTYSIIIGKKDNVCIRKSFIVFGE